MAFWAKLMFVATGVSVIVSVAGVLLIFQTLRQNGLATRIALRSLRQTQRSIQLTQSQIRAYVTISSMDLVREGDVFKVKLILSNDGQTPARHVRNWIRMGVRMLAGEDFSDDDVSVSTTVIGPAKLVTVSGEIQPRAEELAQMAAGSRTVFIWGKTTYKDFFGKDRYLSYRGSAGTIRGESRWAIACSEHGDDVN
jgi:hypothetical protein